jgi:hypothetical protein
LIEFDLAFRELGKNWGDFLAGDAACEVLVGRVGIDVGISNLRLFESFAFLFVEGDGNGALADYRAQGKIGKEVLLLFELGNGKGRARGSVCG